MTANYKYMILAICSLFLGLVYMTMSSWAICLPALQKAFSLSSFMVMMGSAALIAGYAVGSFVEGRLMARYGWRKVFNWVIVIFVIATILIPLVENYPFILFLRFLQGWGLVVTITNTLVCGWFPTQQRGLASGFLLGFIAVGVAVGSVITAYTTPVYGWKFNFYLMAVLTVAGMALFNALAKTPPDAIEGDIAAAAGEGMIKIPEGKSIYSHPVMILLGLGMFCVFFNVYGMYSFMAAYFYDIGFSTEQVGAICFWNGMIGLASTPFGGWIGDVFVKRGVHPIKARAYSMSVVAFFVGFIGCVLMPSMAPVSFGMAILAALITGWGCPAANGPICSLPADIFGTKKGGEAVGFILLIAGLGGVISPPLVSYIAETAGWTVGWYVTGASALVGFIIVIMLPALSMPRNAEKS